MSDTILVVEDDLTLRETIAYNLRHQGYNVAVAGEGRQALRIAGRERPALVILDIMLPGLDGFEVCRRLRQELSVPIIMLTARGDEVDRVVGLEMGADDYLTKPFSMRELMARVKALLRRVRLIREEVRDAAVDERERNGAPVPVDETLVFGDLEIDQSRYEVRRGGLPLRLKPKEYELLLFLARHRGMALSRDLILSRVWGWEYDGNSRTVDVHVRWLREKIEKDPSQAERIITLRGIGYRFDG